MAIRIRTFNLPSSYLPFRKAAGELYAGTEAGGQAGAGQAGAGQAAQGGGGHGHGGGQGGAQLVDRHPRNKPHPDDANAAANTKPIARERNMADLP